MRVGLKARVAFVAGSFVGSIATAGAAPVRDAIVLGGDCETDSKNGPSDGNMFHSDFLELAKAFKRRNWNVAYLFDGSTAKVKPVPGAAYDPSQSLAVAVQGGPLAAGSAPPNGAVLAPECEGASPPAYCPKYIQANGWSRDLIAQAAGVAPEKVRSSTRQNLLDALDREIETLPQGAELLIAVDTHGRGRVGNHDHEICMADGSMSISDPEFLSRLSKLKSRGIRLGFTDSSCFGGGSVSSLGEYGCVVTSQTANRVAYGSGVSGSLAETLSQAKRFDPKRPVSLEDVYLDTLSTNLSMQPQMSGEPDRTISELVSALTEGEADGWETHLPEGMCSLSNADRMLSDLAKEFSVISAHLDFARLDKLWDEEAKSHWVFGPKPVITPFSRLASELDSQAKKFRDKQGKFEEDASLETGLLGQLLALLPVSVRNDALKLRDLFDGKMTASPEQSKLLDQLRTVRKRLDGESGEIRRATFYLSALVSQARFAIRLASSRHGSDACSSFQLLD